jgi:hypothetical protein
MMEKKFAFMLVAAAILPLAGCTKTEQASSTATVANENETTQSATTPAPSAKMDSDVVQTGATVEEPALLTPASSSGQVGATAPTWENLEGTDGKQHKEPMASSTA